MKQFFFFLLIALFLHGETPPSPYDLEPNWYEYLAPEGQLDPSKIDPFIAKLKEAVDEQPEEKKKELTPYYEKILPSIRAFETASEKRGYVEKNPFKEKKSYSLSEVLALFSDSESMQLAETEDEAELKEGEHHLTSLETALLKVRKQYQDAEKNSPEKLQLGLQLIQLRMTHETAKRELKALKEAIDTRKELLDKIQIELAAAGEKLQVTPQEIQKQESDLKESESSFKKFEENLKLKEEKTIGLFAFTPKSDEEKLRNRKLSTEITLDSIETAGAFADWLQNQLSLAVSKIALSGVPGDLDAVEEELSKWGNDISAMRLQSEEWKNSLTHSIEQSEEWLSVNSGSPLIPLQEETLKLAQTASANLSKLESQLSRILFTKTLLEKSIGKTETGIGHYLFNFKEALFTSFLNLQDRLSTPLISYGETIITLGSLFKFFFILIGAFVFAKVVDSLIFKLAPEERRRKAVLWRVSRLFQYAILTIAFFVALSALGFDLSNLVLLVSALGVGLGFGLQTLFNNFVSGLIILFESQIKVGDFVELESGVIGEVKEINVRSTYIHTNDGIDVIVPNSEFTQDRVINWTLKEPYRRVQIPFSVSYESDKELVKKVVSEAVAAVPLTLKQPWIPEPKVYLTDFGASSLNFKVNVWVDAVATRRTSYTHSAYLWAIHDALKKHQIEIPYPQLDLHMKKGETP